MTDHIALAIEALKDERDELDELIAMLEQRAGKGGLETPGGANRSPPVKGRERRKKAAKKTARKKLTAKPTNKATSTLGKTAPANHPQVAAWRAKLLRPILKHKAGSIERAGAIRDFIGTEVTRPDGTAWTVTKSSAYMWIRQAEAA